jgi:hypothetical protein
MRSGKGKKHIQKNEMSFDFRRDLKKWSDALLRSFCRIVRDISLNYEEIVFGATFRISDILLR